ncbi:MAG: hypothetical protein ABJD07_02210 [Gemmatimonadaceae bacterium]
MSADAILTKVNRWFNSRSKAQTALLVIVAGMLVWFLRNPSGVIADLKQGYESVHHNADIDAR